jgi:hypothetical protein
MVVGMIGSDETRHTLMSASTRWLMVVSGSVAFGGGCPVTTYSASAIALELGNQGRSDVRMTLQQSFHSRSVGLFETKPDAWPLIDRGIRTPVAGSKMEWVEAALNCLGTSSTTRPLACS